MTFKRSLKSLSGNGRNKLLIKEESDNLYSVLSRRLSSKTIISKGDRTMERVDFQTQSSGKRYERDPRQGWKDCRDSGNTTPKDKKPNKQIDNL